MTNPTATDFLEAGFTEYAPAQLSMCARVLAKWVSVYGRRAFNVVVSYYVWDDHDGWQAEVQFNVHDEQPTFNVTLLRVESPEQVVEFFTKIWVSMLCGYYD